MAVAPSLETAVAELPRRQRAPEAPEPQRPYTHRQPGDHGFPLADLEFPGCYSRPMSVAEYENHKGRIEFFDTRSRVAWMAAEPVHFAHEAPRAALGRLVQCIAQVRGSPILCLPEMSIRFTFAGGGEGGKKESQVVQPDSSVYLHPVPVMESDHELTEVGESPHPDVVLEVDNTTDVRRNRLKLYEAGDFPEVWVEVPNRASPSRPRGLRAGLTIHLLEEGRFVESEVSRAFPGWRAEEIHRALNSWGMSDRTTEELTRVGRVLGEREGTGPDDDPLLRRHGAEQRAEGRAEERTAIVRALLRGRGIVVPAHFPEGLPLHHLHRFRAASRERVLAAATAAVSFSDFVARLDNPEA